MKLLTTNMNPIKQSNFEPCDGEHPQLSMENTPNYRWRTPPTIDAWSTGELG